MVPPPVLVAAAIKITEVPAQTGTAAFAAIVTAGVRFGLTSIKMALELIVSGAAQARLEVMTTLTISPLTKAAAVKVAALAPGILLPFTCH